MVTIDTTEDGAQGKNKGHRWQKGQSGSPENKWEKGRSGNPRGRPRKKRRGNPAFQKGVSGNPQGRAIVIPGILGNLAAEARKYAAMALENLVDLAQNAEGENVRLNATLALLNRAYGLPQQSVELKTDGPQVQVNLFQDFSTEEQRLAAETLAAINANPAALSLALDVMNDPAAMTMTILPDEILDLTVEPVPVREDDIIDAEVVEVE
jgi:hypothetical protein